jgi:small subunit ribosomal protein S1
MDAKLEAEIEAALGDVSVEDMLDYADRPKPVAGERERRRGTIVSVHGEDVFVEFGPKSPGVCPITQFDAPPVVGESLEFEIDRYDAAEGLLLLSRRGVVRKADWEAMEVGQVVEARCTGTNKGGLDMEVAGHRAFMPAGQVDLRHIPDLGVFVGEKLTCEVIELDRTRGRIVLSRRRPLEADRARRREELLAKLQEGETVAAIITSIKPYGAFADLGGIDGLIHVSDLSHERVKDPAQVVKEGDRVNVKILKIDRETDPPRIGLGLKQTLADPFASSVQALEVGAIMQGRVTRIAPFGAFVELAPGVEGLVHISELSHDRVAHVGSVVKPDEIVSVKVLAIDAEQRRIALSMKAARAAADADDFSRREDPELRRLKAQLNRKFGGPLKGGLG